MPEPPDPKRPLDHLARALEELLRAGANALALWQEREGPALRSLRETLAREVTRWELRSADDPAAARVRDLFAAVLDLIEPDPSPPKPRSDPSPRRRTRRRVDQSSDRVGYSRRWPF